MPRNPKNSRSHRGQKIPAVDRLPVHTVYGGANRFRSDTALKFGQVALETLQRYAPTQAAFAKIFDIDTKLAAAIYKKTIAKLKSEPIEDIRIDFEDGFGYRTDREEDEAAADSARELVEALKSNVVPPFCGIRVRPFSREWIARARRTTDLFIETVLSKGVELPRNFVVTLPKVRSAVEVQSLAKHLAAIERRFRLGDGAIGIELMIETPEAIFDQNGRVAIEKLTSAAGSRCRSVHFGAYDYTALLGISAADQDIHHPACDFARSVLQVALAGSRIRLVDSVTIQIPIPIHRSESPGKRQQRENATAVRDGWRRHFDNVTRSMRNGIFQSWDLHPNQLPARYAAVYSYFIGNAEKQAARLRSFFAAAATASVTGNVFDDAASAEGALNFFRIGAGCGAFSDAEIKEMLGCPVSDLFRPFPQIVMRMRK